MTVARWMILVVCAFSLVSCKSRPDQSGVSDAPGGPRVQEFGPGVIDCGMATHWFYNNAQAENNDRVCQLKVQIVWQGTNDEGRRIGQMSFSLKKLVDQNGEVIQFVYDPQTGKRITPVLGGQDSREITTRHWDSLTVPFFIFKYTDEGYATFSQGSLGGGTFDRRFEIEDLGGALPIFILTFPDGRKLKLQGDIDEDEIDVG